MKQVAKFMKVSSFQFEKDLKNTNPEKENGYEQIILPQRATKGSAGYDFFIPFDLELKSGETAIIPTGIRVQIDEGYFLALYPKSGLGFKFRLRLENTVGIIDSDYYFSDNEGHIFIKLTNDSNEGKTVELAAGQGFAQGIFLPFGITEDDEVTQIRNGGFGSTTK